MKTFFATIALPLFSVTKVLAHEEGVGVSNVSEADWVGPLVAAAIIAASIIIARVIRTRSKK